ncbi:MAG: hypothetical protein ACRDGE_08840 [Candidatus Limnocylindria bacterium]
MPSSFQVGEIRAALAARSFPSVTVWNRLEGRPRTPGFERALQAEVRDALWLLTRQWQLGEFRGSDAGSPVFAKLQLATTRLTKYRPDDQAAELLPVDVPLEAKAERRPIPLSLDLRLLMGRQWLALVASVGDYRRAFVDAYPIVAPDPSAREDAARAAHPEVRQLYGAVAGRAMDGGALYEHLVVATGNHSYDGVAGIDPADHDALEDREARFLAWVDRLFLQPPPSGDDAWIPPRLEYQFAVSAPEPDGAEKVYAAEEYYQGQLDWYSLDLGAEGLDEVPGSEDTGLPPDEPRTMIPVPVTFKGMPNTRWWAFEDGETNFGDVDASTTDLAKLLFLEFALVFGNDWFVVPYTLPAAAIATIRGLVVTNVFGERLWIEPAGGEAGEERQQWSMFTIDVEDEPAAAPDTSLLLLPTASKIHDGAPIEDVALIRDEVANMVWGVERTVQLPSGEAKPGLEAALQTRAFFEALVAAQPGGTPEPELPPRAPIRYRVMTTVPENWIPFVPVHVEGSNREIQLQRAALPRIVEGDREELVKVQPRTRLLREGLDRTPAELYFVHEEEVPRAGSALTQLFQRTRWTDGRVYVWLRVRRQTGRSEGTSGLRFDELTEVAPAQDAVAES